MQVEVFQWGERGIGFDRGFSRGDVIGMLVEVDAIDREALAVLAAEGGEGDIDGKELQQERGEVDHWLAEDEHVVVDLIVLHHQQRLALVRFVAHQEEEIAAHRHRHIVQTASTLQHNLPPHLPVEQEVLVIATRAARRERPREGRSEAESIGLEERRGGIEQSLLKDLIVGPGGLTEDGGEVELRFRSNDHPIKV